MNGMNASYSFDAMNVIVTIALAFTVVMLIAWLLSPALRVWIEKPKYRFMASVEQYDQAQQRLDPK